MANSERLPITIEKTPGGYRIDFGDGRARLYLYAESERAASTGLRPSEAEAFIKEVARTLRAAWRSGRASARFNAEMEKSVADARPAPRRRRSRDDDEEIAGDMP